MLTLASAAVVPLGANATVKAGWVNRRAAKPSRVSVTAARMLGRAHDTADSSRASKNPLKDAFTVGKPCDRGTGQAASLGRCTFAVRSSVMKPGVVSLTAATARSRTCPAVVFSGNTGGKKRSVSFVSHACRYGAPASSSALSSQPFSKACPSLVSSRRSTSLQMPPSFEVLANTCTLEVTTDASATVTVTPPSVVPAPSVSCTLDVALPTNDCMWR
mmetsp:Transcript_3976/g.12933  ORF Transcript_3976/g.12933 Transcript_3976/m.12933 type:complete len:217 (+) Transcript_3976:1124-1774(+)